MVQQLSMDTSLAPNPYRLSPPPSLAEADGSDVEWELGELLRRVPSIFWKVGALPVLRFTTCYISRHFSFFWGGASPGTNSRTDPCPDRTPFGTTSARKGWAQSASDNEAVPFSMGRYEAKCRRI